MPFASALAGLGLPWQRLLWLRAAQAQLWVAEQALRCAPVDAVLLWLAQARPQELRRLQLAAAQHHKLLFVMRHSDAAHTASPAVLRVQIAPCATHATGLRVEILKRRGPPLAQALHILPAQGQLACVLAAALSPAPLAAADTASPGFFADAPALDRAAA